MGRTIKHENKRIETSPLIYSFIILSFSHFIIKLFLFVYWFVQTPNPLTFIRHLDFLAFLRPVGSKRPEVERHLSIPYTKKVTTLMTAR